jgi:hypothetical protein
MADVPYSLLGSRSILTFVLDNNLNNCTRIWLIFIH